MPPGAGGRRGKIKGWSSSSRRRFRDWLLKHEADSEIFAVTLTVPGDVVTPDQWRSLFDAFSKFLSKKVSVPFGVWRHRNVASLTFT